MLEFKATSIDITRKPSVLSGFASRQEPVETVHSLLEATAFLFRSQGAINLFITLDTLFVSGSLKNFVLEYLRENFDELDESNVWISASHTHYAPSLEEKRWALGKVDVMYLDFLKGQITTLLESLRSLDFASVYLEYAEGQAEGVTTNRRRKARFIRSYFRPEILIEPTNKGVKDESLKLVKVIENDSNNLLGVFWNFACHPTNLHNSKLISSEFPGAIRNTSRTLARKDIPVAFFQGFSGNIRAAVEVKGSFNFWIRKVLQLSYPVRFYRFENSKEYEGWINGLTGIYKRIWSNTSQMASCELRTTTIYKEKIKTILGITAEGVDELIFRSVSFGDDLTLVSISAEVVSEYSTIVKKSIDSKNIFMIGYTDEVFGYLPTSKHVKEGGYESNGFFEPFLIKGEFTASLETKIEECLKNI
ncbi:MAG: neutral ceramidase [Crocinitomicaceae bacterium]|jgi:neutral ceramidase